MKFRRLGKTGIEVSEIGFGAWGIGGQQWLGGEDDGSLRALHRAIELGVNFIDTALAYGAGHSEKLVGQVIREAPGKIWVATKIPPKNQLWPARPGIGIEEVFPYEYAIKCTEKSLRNLGVETLDLQQFHVWNPEWIGRDEWRRAIEDLKKSGKVRNFGISINDHQPDSAIELINTGMIETVQVIYNIFDQSPETSLFPLCRKADIGVLARVPLDEGTLTGTLAPDTKFPKGDFREYYFRGDHLKQAVEHAEALKADLRDQQDSLAETALRFVISNPAVSSVIPGMRRVSTVESSTSVSKKGPLPAELIARLRKHAWNKNFYS
jgi:aryl-alcohol dehydrogenase-like predicted oxidoreductase